jgi:hypothetical protein
MPPGRVLFVSFVDFLEAGFGRFIARVDVRVVLAGKPAVSLLDFLLSCIAADAEQGIVVF